MKTNLIIPRRGLVCFLIVLWGALACQGINDCIDNPYYTTGWTCSQQGTVLTHGVLSQTNISACAGSFVSAPFFTTAPTFNNGQKTATLHHTTCPPYDEQVYQTVSYYAASLSFVKTNAAWPNLPGTFSSPGTYYYIAKFNGIANGGVCNNIIGVTSAVVAVTITSSPPVIVTQPTNQTVNLGGTATFNVVATGCPSISYQWWFNATNLIVGAASSTLTLTNVQLTNGGNYTVVLTNVSGAVTSSVAVLSVSGVCSPAPAGLVGWWAAESNPYDSAGTNNGTTPYGIAYNTGKVGVAFDFNGSNRRVSVPDSGDFKLTNSLTIEGWIYPRAQNSGYIFCRADKRPYAGPWTLQVSPSNNLSFQIANISNQTATIRVQITTNQWYHIAATLEGTNGNMRIYTNGVLAVQTNTLIRPYRDLESAEEPALGIGNHGGVYGSIPFNGLIDEVSLYSRALTQGEIQSIYGVGAYGKCPIAPAIKVQPINQTVNRGDDVTFQVTAVGTQPLSFRWYFNGGQIVGAMSSSLLITNVQSSNGGTYSVVITNIAGTATSSNAVLTVKLPPLITSQPQSIAVFPGSNATFSVTATGATPLIYQWRFNGTNISGATNSTYTRINAQVADAGDYSVVITNTAGSAVSSDAALTVYVAPSVTVQPTNQTIVQGSNAIFVATGNGTQPLWYQWRFNGVDIAGANESVYVRGNIGPSDAGNYMVVVTNIAGRTTNSTPAVLVVIVPPLITLQPSNQVLVQGATAHFSVSISNTSTLPLTYQWYTNGVPLTNGTKYSGVNSGTLYVTNTTLTDCVTYWVGITNIAGNITSAPAILSLTPSITAQPTNRTVVQGSNVTFTVTASGSLPLSYQWMFNGTNIGGANSNSLTLYNAQPVNAGLYSVIVANSAGTSVSSNATLAVIVPPVITSQPHSINVNQGATTNFSVGIDGSSTTPLAYQWYTNGVALANGSKFAGVNTYLLWITNATSADAGTYTVAVSNSGGSVTTVGASLAVAGIDRIIVDGSSPEIQGSTSVVLGSTLILRAMASPTNATFTGTVPVWTITNPFGVTTTNFGVVTITNTYLSVGQYGITAQCGTAIANFNVSVVSTNDANYNGINDNVEIMIGTNAQIQLGSWQFDTPDFAGLQGQVPLSSTNVNSVAGWSILAAGISSTNPVALLSYREQEAGASVANINLRNGTVMLWFRGDWNSVGTNSGVGPQREGRLIEVGDKGSTNGCWGLYFDPSGTNLNFCTETNATGTAAVVQTNLTGSILWRSNDWHQVVLTYSSSNSSMYIDGVQSKTNGVGVSNWPAATVRTNGFRIGSGIGGTNNWANGRFDDLETYNYAQSWQSVSNYYKHHPQPHGTNTCLLAPLAFYVSIATTLHVGDTNTSIIGGGSGNFGYLNWNGASPDPLKMALTNWSYSQFFVNAQDSTDTNLSVGDWIHGNSGWQSSVTSSLDWLIANATNGFGVVLWNENNGLSGANVQYRAAQYARVQLLNYTNNDHSVTYKYLGLTSCDSYVNQAPIAQLISPTNNQVFNVASNSVATVLLSAYASDPENNLKSVKFYWGTNDLSCTNYVGAGINSSVLNDTTNTYSFLWTNAPHGSNTIKVVAEDELGLTATSQTLRFLVNWGPWVNAGPDITTNWPEGAVLSLSGRAGDSDSVPQALTTTWSFVSGSGTAMFQDSNSPTTRVTFSTNGSYMLRLTATDGAVTVSSNCAVTIRRRPTVAITWPTNNYLSCPGTPISVTANATDPNGGNITAVQFYTNSSVLGAGVSVGGGFYSLSPDWTSAVGGTNAISAIAWNDAGLSYTSDVVTIWVPPALRVNAGTSQRIVLGSSPVSLTLSAAITGGTAHASAFWQCVSGPTSETWTNAASTNATVTFYEGGNYLLRFSASDECSADFSTVLITVATNQVPIVDAGPDLTLNTNSTAYLNGLVKDDGLLLPVSNWWHVVSQPVGADARFSATNSAVTTATNLTVPGVYTLCLSAYDGLATGSNTMKVYVVPTGSRTWTFDADFEEGTLLNVNYDDVPDQLQLNHKIEPFPYVWVACSGRGTIVRIDVNTGQVLGEYRTTPESINDYGSSGYSDGPSRTTVDKNGNVWVGNRGDNGYSDPVTGEWVAKGSVTRIGVVIGGTRGWIQTNDAGVVTNFVPDPKGEYLQPPFKYCTAVDRNHDGYIHTSFGLTNLLHWDRDISGTNNSGGVSAAEDECIINYTRVSGLRVRAIAIDANNDVWVGGNDNGYHEKISGVTGQPISNTGVYIGSGYGAVIDGNGVLWSANGVTRFDPVSRLDLSVNPPVVTNENYYGTYITGNYGIGIDPNAGNIWCSDGSSGVIRISPDGNQVDRFYNPLTSGSGGIAVDAHSNVWVASHAGRNYVAHFRTDGSFVGNVDMGCSGGANGPTGVAIDGNGKVWAACLNTGRAMRIDPNKGALGAGGIPLGAVDMTVELDDTNVMSGVAPNPYGSAAHPVQWPPYANPYNYSDMTGFISVGETEPSGTWTAINDSGVTNMPWGLIFWNALTNADTHIKVEVKAAASYLALNDTNNNFIQITNGVPFSGVTGRVAQVRVTMSKSATSTNTPILYDLTLMPAGSTVMVTNGSASQAASDVFGVLADSVSNVLDVLPNDPIYSNANARIVSCSAPQYGIVSTNTLTLTTTNIYNLVQVHPPGTVLYYTPNPTFTGKDRFTYTVTDGRGQWGRAIVRTTVVKSPATLTSNDVPQPQPDSFQVDTRFIVNENSATNFLPVLENDANTLSIVGFTQPANGFVQRHPCGLLYTPNAGFIGTNSFTYTVTSAAGARATTNVTVKVVSSQYSQLDVYLGSHQLHNGDTILMNVTGIGSSVTNTLFLINSGTEDLTVNDWAISPNGGPFSISGSAPQTLSPDSSTYPLNVIFTSTIAGTTNGVLVIYTNGASAPAISINFRAQVASTGGPGIQIIAPANNAEFAGYKNITLVASNSSGTVPTNVVFVFETADGAFKIGEKTTAPYAITWPSVTPGSYTLRAYGFDNANNVGISAPVNIVVHDPPPPTNAPPIATDDQLSIPMLVNGTTNYAIDVLANDYSPAFFSLAVVDFSSSGQLGRLTQSGNILYYSPILGKSGDDVLQYTISDGHGGAATARILVHIFNTPPPSVRIIQPTDGYGRLPTNFLFLSTASVGVTNVTYFDHDQAIGSSTNAGANFPFNWVNIVDGDHAIVAVATDTNGFYAYSQTIFIQATAPNGNSPPIADINNLVPIDYPSDLELPSQLPLVQDALTNLIGTAGDIDGDPVAYRVLLYDVNGKVVGDFTPPDHRDSSRPGFHIGSGTNITLATLDLSQFESGIYEVELTVNDTWFETSARRKFNLQSEMKIGNLSFHVQDLTIPINGIPLTVVRSYNSRRSDVGAFGPSWAMALNDMDVKIDEQRKDVADDDGEMVNLRVGGGYDVTLTLPNGRRVTYQFTPRASTSSPGDYYAEWKKPPGVQDELLPLGNPVFRGLNHQWVAAGWAWNLLPQFDFPGWELDTKDGTRYIIERENMGEHDFTGALFMGGGYSDDPDIQPTTDQGSGALAIRVYGEPHLARIIERTGDRIEIGANGIQHFNPVGELTTSLSFDRNDQGRITALYDPIAQTNSNGVPTPVVKYVYGAHDNLIQVLWLNERAANGGSGSYSATTYEYTNTAYPHLITSIVDPRGFNVVRYEYDDSGRLHAVADAENRRTQFFYDIGNQVFRWTDRLGKTETVGYDLRGNVTAITNALNGVTLIGYDENNNKTNDVVYLDGQPYASNQYTYTQGYLLQAAINPLGFSNTFEYNDNGQVTRMIRPCGCSGATNYYDDRTGLILASSDAMGNVASNFYNADGTLGTFQDSIGVITTNTYDAAGNLLSTATLDKMGILSSNTFAYDANGMPVQSVIWRRVDGRWNAATNQFIYDAQGRLTQMVEPDGGTNMWIYDGSGLKRSSVDKVGRTTTYDYDGDGRLMRTTYPDLTTERAYYDAEGRLTNVVDRAGRATSMIYDELGRLTKTIFPNGTSSATIYDTLGRVRFAVNARGVTNAFGYDAMGRRIAETNAWGTSCETYRTTSLDADGNALVITNNGRTVITNVFDTLNRLVKTQFPDGTSVSYGYDAAGRRIAETNQQNFGTWFGYDGLGRLLAVTNNEGKVTQYKYDEAGNEIAQIDALNRTNRLEYDAMGRRVKRILGGGQVESFSYNPAGNLTYHTNFNGDVITNEYDMLNRITNRSSINGYQVAFKYSTTGLRTEMRDQVGLHTYMYDNVDRLIQYAGPAGMLTYGYDPVGDITNVTSSTANGTSTSYEYDIAGRLTNVIDLRLSGFQGTSYGYDTMGNVRTISYPNGATNVLQYDIMQRPTNLTWSAGATRLADFSYGLGVSGNRTNLVENIGGTARTYSWAYNSVYRLTNETITGAAPTGSLGYAFDDVGNRTNRSGSLASIGWQSLKYDNSDRLDDDGSASSPSLWFDANGATTNLFGIYKYDIGNHLTIANSNVIILYDGDGNRVVKIANGVTNIYLVDRLSPSGNTQVLEELRAGANGTNLVAAYTYGNALISQRRPDSGIGFYGQDLRGNIRFLMDGAGNISDTYTYDAFGTLIASTGTTSNDHLFAGELYDRDLSLYYLRARYFSPDLGRFWTMDEFEGADTVPASLHKYNYVHGDPVNYSDPTGLFDSGGSSAVLDAMPDISTVVKKQLVQKQLPKAGVPSALPQIGSATLTASMISVAATINSGNYNVKPNFANPQVQTMFTTTGKDAENACSILANAKPGENQYFYSPHSFGRATGVAAVIWKKQFGDLPVDPPGLNAAKAQGQKVDRGHLVPYSYGGSGGFENVVAQEQSFNRGTFRVATVNALASKLAGGSSFVCMLCGPVYAHVGEKGVKDVGRPVPAAFVLGMITSDSYEGSGYLQPQLFGDWKDDIEPWNMWATGVVSLNY